MVLDDALAVEEQYRLLDLKVDEYSYWEYFRYSFYDAIVQQKEDLSDAHPINNVSRFKKIIRLLHEASDFFDLKHRAGTQADYLFLNGGRRTWNGTVYEDPFTDDLMEHLDNSIFYEFAYAGKHRKPARTKFIIYDNIYTFDIVPRAIMRRLIMKGEFLGIKDEISSRLTKPLGEICRLYDVTMDLNAFFNEVATNYYVHRMLRKAYSSILDTVKPKVIILVCHYDIQKMTFCELAKEKGIPVVELQHGIISSEHPAYNYSKCELIPQFPDYVLLFSSYWKHNVRFPIDDNRVVSVGYPYAEKRMRSFRESTKRNDLKIVLFLSQPTVEPCLSEVAIGLDELLDHEKYRIIYKLHPSDCAGWKSRYNSLVCDTIDVIDNTDSDLYELFAGANAVVSTGDTFSVYEGLLFELPTYIYSPKAFLMFRRLIDMGYAREFTDVRCLLEYLQTQGNCAGETDKPELWEYDSLDKMEKVIKTIGERQ